MKYQQQRAKCKYKLGDLILAVRASSKNKHEMLAVIADLIESGRVRFQIDGRSIRAHLC